MKRAVIIFLAAGCMMMLIPLFTFGLEERGKISYTPQPESSQSEESRVEKDKSQIVESVMQILTNMNKNENILKPDELQENGSEKTEPNKMVIKVSGGEKFKVFDIATEEVFEFSQIDYLIGALAAEAEKDDELEYLRAMGVVLNTCALKNREANIAGEVSDLDGADFFINSTEDEGYISKEKAKEKFGSDFDEVWGNLTAAAEYAAEFAVVYDGSLAVTPFHEMSAGRTESAEKVWGSDVPYLKTVISTGDVIASDGTSVTEFSATELKKLLSDFDENIVLDGNEENWFGGVIRSEAGYVSDVEVGNKMLSGTELRIALGLKSSCFEISRTDSGFIFTVKGEGHGVGMSKNGARFLAKEGRCCDEIIKKYYAGSEVARVQIG